MVNIINSRAGLCVFESQLWFLLVYNSGTLRFPALLGLPAAVPMVTICYSEKIPTEISGSKKHVGLSCIGRAQAFTRPLPVELYEGWIFLPEMISDKHMEYYQSGKLMQHWCPEILLGFGLVCILSPCGCP